MIYLDSFRFPTAEQEECFFDTKRYVPADIYPWRLLSSKGFERIDCDRITILYGGNGSGKSTALNTIARTIGVERATPYNCGYYHYDDFIARCSYEVSSLLTSDISQVTTMITSDDIFDDILDTRKLNIQHELRSDALSDFYHDKPTMRSVDCENPTSIRSFIQTANAKTMSQRGFVRANIGDKRRMYSNGEAAYLRLVNKINKGLYLLDEPENSLSARWQAKLAEYIRLSAYGCDCQFIIATHSPFLLAIEGAKIYNMDEDYVTLSRWHELESTKLYYELFKRLNGII